MFIFNDYCSYPSVEVHCEYVKNVQVWLTSAAKAFTQDTSLTDYSRQIDYIKRCYSVIQQKRQEFARSPLPIRGVTIQRIVTSLNERMTEIEKCQKEFASLVKKVEKQCVDDMSIRLAILNKKNSKEVLTLSELGVLGPVKDLLSKVSNTIQELQGHYLSLKSLSESFEEQRTTILRKDLNDLFFAIDVIEQNLPHCIEGMKNKLDNVQKTIQAASKVNDDFSQYRRRMGESLHSYKTLTPSSSAESLIEGKTNHKLYSTKSKGWACSICSVVNDKATNVCDACYHHRF